MDFNPDETTTVAVSRGTKRELERIMPDDETTFDELLADLAGDREATKHGKIRDIERHFTNEFIENYPVSLGEFTQADLDVGSQYVNERMSEVVQAVRDAEAPEE